jgi:hypothetical protein
MAGSLAIHIASYDEAQAREMAQTLRDLHASSDGRHHLTEDPHAADLVLVAGIGNEVRPRQYLELLLDHELIGRHADKCFTLSFRDRPLVLNRGIYTSAPCRTVLGCRSAGGAYQPHQFSRYTRLQVGIAAPDRRDLLLSFVGRDCHPVRRAIYRLGGRRPDVLIEDSSDFSLWHSSMGEVESDARQRRFADILRNSKFALCPRGTGTGSIRLFEAMSMAVAPVIVSDGWIAPEGPDWDEFSIRIAENDVEHLIEVVQKQESRYLEMGRAAQRAYRRHFAADTYFNHVVDTCVRMNARQRIPESAWWKARHVMKYALGREAIDRNTDLLRYYRLRVANVLRARS